MKKRILAWVMLIGFLLLIVNITFFQVMLPASVFLYIFIVLMFLFSNKKSK